MVKSSNEKFYREYPYDTAKLTASQKRVLTLLKEAARLAGQIYVRQENYDYPGANFYPRDAAKEEILQAAKANPAILDPYTVVERDKSGQLMAVPYSQKYTTELKKMASLLNEAAEATKDKSLAQYLRARADAFLSDGYDESEGAWLGLEGNQIDILIGPIESRYIDKLLAIKCAFQANLRVTSREKGFDPADYIEVLKNMHGQRVAAGGDAKAETRAIVRVDDVIALSGWHARLIPSASNYPNDPDQAAKYGSKILVYTTTLKDKANQQIYPIFKTLFADDFTKAYTSDLFMDNAVRAAMLHEAAELVAKFPGDTERLQDSYAPVVELYASVAGIKSAGFHVLKGVITQKDFESMLLVFICRAFRAWIRKKESRSIDPYLQGYVAALNFFVEEDAIQVNDQHLWINFGRVFVVLDNLVSVLRHFLVRGSREEAAEFFAQHDSPEVFEKFEKTLAGITTKA